MNKVQTTERDRFEAGLKQLFGEKICDIKAGVEHIAHFKDGSFAMSELGLMLYTNGYNLRGISNFHPDGLMYYDGTSLFGVGYFAKENENDLHLHIVAPKGMNRVRAVSLFIDKVRQSGLSQGSVFVRHLSEKDKDDFLKAGFSVIDSDPWHPDAPEEDETFPNRVFQLDRLFESRVDGVIRIKNLDGEVHKGHKEKNRLAYQRFLNFLVRNELSVDISPYGYSNNESKQAREVVEQYFEARRKIGGLVGSTPEDYFALIFHQPSGFNERDFFSYLGKIKSKNGKEVPIAFFAGEKVSDDKVAMYATITMRFPEYFEAIMPDTTGFTAIPQYVWLSVFKLMWERGVLEVDAGGSETQGLDNQKEQLGGAPEKSYWVVKA